MINQIAAPLLGGVLIGLASTLMLAGAGKIAGISGILGSVLGRPQSQYFWRYSFLFGLVGVSMLTIIIWPESFIYEFNFSYTRAIIAGLLVGFGTRLGSGCTSGHGVCGISRLSMRSVIATITFIFFGVLTVFLMKEFYGTELL